MPGDIFKMRKIVVRGARAVGKSCLVLQRFESCFRDYHQATIEETYSKSITYNEIEYECQIIDTAGQDEFSILNPKHAIGIHGFVLVYSVASWTSFEMVKIEYDKINDFCGRRGAPVVIVGQKSDLPRREVSWEQAQSLARQLGCACIETSARDNYNVDKVFELCLAEIENFYPRRSVLPPPDSRCLLM